MLNNLEEKDMQKHHYVTIRNHPGANTDDMVHLARAHARKKPDAVVVMAGTNDITENRKAEELNKKNGKSTDQIPKINSCENMQNMIREIKSQLPEARIAICQVTARKDQPDIMKDVDELNQKLRLLAQREQIDWVKTGTFKKWHTGYHGVHPNPQGKDELKGIFKRYIATL